MNLSIVNIYKSDTGHFKVVNNESTFTDYTRGENKTFSIAVGSDVYITHNAADCITGTLSLSLYYDHVATPATGNFKIFH